MVPLVPSMLDCTAERIHHVKISLHQCQLPKLEVGYTKMMEAMPMSGNVPEITCGVHSSGRLPKTTGVVQFE